MLATNFVSTFNKMKSCTSTKVNTSILSKIELKKSIWLNINELLLFAKFFSACPLSIVCNPNRPSNRFQNFLQLLVQVIWSSLTLALVLFALHYYILMYWVYGPLTIIKSLQMTEILLNIGTIFLIIIGCNLSGRKCYHQYIDSLAEIDYKIDHHLTNENIRHFIRCCLIFVAVNFVIALILTIVTYELNVIETSSIIMIYFAPITIHVMAMLQYCCLLLAMAERYEAIGKYLQDTSKSSKEMVKFCSGTHHDKRIQIVQQVIRTTHMFGQAQIVSDRLKILRRCYFELGQLAHRVNGTFGVLIVGQVATAFIVVCSQSYYCYLFVSQRSADAGIGSLVFALLWTGMHSAKVFVVLSLCSKVSNMVIYLYFHYIIKITYKLITLTYNIIHYTLSASIIIHFLMAPDSFYTNFITKSSWFEFMTYCFLLKLF